MVRVSRMLFRPASALGRNHFGLGPESSFRPGDEIIPASGRNHSGPGTSAGTFFENQKGGKVKKVKKYSF